MNYYLKQYFVRRLKKVINKRNKDVEQRIRNNKFKYKLDYIVRERWVEFYVMLIIVVNF